ncbi:hypothetical protein [Actinomadura rupiterrae]|uniref:hypothetical protein n=1 Tax=Actinomadura rupiterrae TaxID=559627 RepID=UPI0020A23655|nr:hypothetical protein [Actinomadura rupiterrae]MCP2335880.1 hypothetical protein [Actinomadura rupiterrae]
MDGPAGEATFLVRFGNTRHVRALGPASSGGVGVARGVAGMDAAAISPVDGASPLLAAEAIAEFGTPRANAGTDPVTSETDHFALGFEAQARRYPAVGTNAGRLATVGRVTACGRAGR